MELEGAVAVVTGGGSGIGRATALLLARRKAQVVVCGRRPEPLAETVELITREGGRGLALPVDVRDEAQVNAMIETLLARFGRLNVLVNSAGVALAKAVTDTTEEEWDKILETNLKGIFLCCRAVLPTMIAAGRGVLINVSSILGRSGLRDYAAYCASKFGVIGLTEAMAAEFRGTGIRIFAVCPGPTFTDLHRRLVGDVSARRSMTPEQVAERIVGLVSDDAPEESPVTVVVDELDLSRPWDRTKGAWRRLTGRMRPMLAAIGRARDASKTR